MGFIMHVSSRSLARCCFALLLLLSVALEPTAYAHKKNDPKRGKPGGSKLGLTWSVKKVEFNPGGMTSVQVDLLSPQAVPQAVVLRVTGGLGNYIAVSPERINSLAAGTPVQITITLKGFPAGGGSQGGVVQARMGERSLGKPLQVKVKVARDGDGD